MPYPIARLLCAAATAAALLPQAQATTIIDFEGDAFSGLYFPGDSTFLADNYVMTTVGDFGVIDTVAALGSSAPSGNATQFYFNSNAGQLKITRSDPLGFYLQGFSAAFVPLEPASTQATVLVAAGTRVDDSEVTVIFDFASSLTSSFPFTAYAGAPAFAAFSNLKSVSFYACSFTVAGYCTEPILNNGQFAIDDILVTTVPEPGTALLLTLGAFALGLRARSTTR